MNTSDLPLPDSDEVVNELLTQTYREVILRTAKEIADGVEIPNREEIASGLQRQISEHQHWINLRVRARAADLIVERTSEAVCSLVMDSALHAEWIINTAKQIGSVQDKADKTMLLIQIGDDLNRHVTEILGRGAALWTQHHEGERNDN